MKRHDTKTLHNINKTTSIQHTNNLECTQHNLISLNPIIQEILKS